MNYCRILIVEDAEERILLFKQWAPDNVRLVFARSAGRAIQVLSLDDKAAYAGIALDHDLNEQVVDDRELAYSGSDVVKRIAAKQSRDTLILIHSMNYSKSHGMKRFLEANGFIVERVPFVNLSMRQFNDWCCRVHEEWSFGRL